MMDSLPPEIILQILEFTIVAFYNNKNGLLKLRTTCKLFNEILKPYVLRTLQLEFTRLDKYERSLRPPLDEDALRRIGPFCQALYLDMMVVRDDGEARLLSDMFSKVRAMDQFVARIRDVYCMNESSFTEIEYRRRLGSMLEHAPNVTAVRLNLPFQLVTRGQYSAATLILGNSFEALAQRPEESETLKTLVLENVSDISIVSLWRNPQDVKNIIGTFSDLRHLFMSVRRNEEGHTHTNNYRNRLWEMIGKAENLESLCLVDLEADEHVRKSIKTSSERNMSLENWEFRCMPTIRKPPKAVLRNLTFLELRQVEVMASGLLSMFNSFESSLRELYLEDVYLKTVYNTEAPEDANDILWIGLPNVRPQPHHRWIATYLRQLRMQLRVCRVANLGYDQYVVGEEPSVEDNSVGATYDLLDPTGLSRSFSQRFVEVATGVRQPFANDGTPVTYYPEDPSQDSWALADREPSGAGLRAEDWHAPSYLASRRSPTSAWQESLDGLFPNSNQFAIDILHQFADGAYKGMGLLNSLHDLGLI
ncbi:uncharacterized protein GGS25DRAFT_494329 [Hypoxylon fragiforme]|uniref:uncharacterized protein n=1 Tax=Hypoxylon fragiforme TaxID=63214 RepID=UPI0020C6ACC1|nr:uncharacterized protein GGS25DRAFT_494329 [Hypoxylon fragiforme]KAI2607091.1 hypothetical protein GGS25DRAFT_494329 [Hypoxylon fragiforme]